MAKRPRVKLSELQARKGGLACRTCGCRHLYLLDSRPSGGGTIRRLACRNCGRRISIRESGSP